MAAVNVMKVFLNMIYSFETLQGIEYMHKSKLKSHGRLKSTNCCIDGRWVLKITDFGLTTIRDVPTEPNEKYTGNDENFPFRNSAKHRQKLNVSGLQHGKRDFFQYRGLPFGFLKFCHKYLYPQTVRLTY